MIALAALVAVAFPSNAAARRRTVASGTKNSGTWSARNATGAPYAAAASESVNAHPIDEGSPVSIPRRSGPHSDRSVSDGAAASRTLGDDQCSATCQNRSLPSGLFWLSTRPSRRKLARISETVLAARPTSRATSRTPAALAGRSSSSTATSSPAGLRKAATRSARRVSASTGASRMRRLDRIASRPRRSR